MDDPLTPERPKLRLVKVVVQAHFVLDDGDHLTEQISQPVEVPAAEWPTYATEQFPADVERALARLVSDANGPPPGT